MLRALQLLLEVLVSEYQAGKAATIHTCADALALRQLGPQERRLSVRQTIGMQNDGSRHCGAQRAVC